ncbi:ethanolamine:proton symporter, EAT family [Selenomonas ruminantium]|uniref:Ethanolamine:proton symporter, EAT family n=1 Tax=Selenomonas ruminantium TaxID=971 RepID=A0A1M6XQN1_SELRU|nr:ethanolamine permease [Selenomonas ruminantium]SHL08310.1 ethanolamine:proton symporter, EAT family [Selenomonas ruminantium]
MSMNHGTMAVSPSGDVKREENLTRVLKPIHLWALAVGLVISGNYFGWSYGFAAGGVMGLALALIPVTIFYVTFILSYSELATAIPHAGGPSAYARRAMGKFGGYLNGISCLIEFVFAPPAIALAVGGYVHALLPAIDPMAATVAAFFFFIFLNYLGMKTSATFELAVTVIALLGLMIYWGLAAPHFDAARVMEMPLLPHGFDGLMAAVPFAIWFFLAIEGGAMSAEEMVDPQRDIPKGFLSGMATLLVMAVLTLFLTAGIADIDAVSAVDFPLPLALRAAYGEGSLPVLLMSGIGLFGLVASLHGIIVGYSRQTYAMARTGYLPKFLARLDEKHHTPVWALVLPGIVCLFTALTGLTDLVITIACYGSVVMYLTSLVSFLILRHKEPALKRPFRVPSMLIPVISVIMAIFCLVSLLMASSEVLPYVVGIYAVSIAYYFLYGNKHIRPFEEEFGVLDELDEEG